MNNRETIHVLCTPDNGFALPYGVMLTSLFENNSDCHFCIWIVTDKLSANNVKHFEETASYYHAELHTIYINKGYYPYLPLKENEPFTENGYYRVFAADLLPNSISKVLYLDGDMIVLGNIKELWQTNIEKYSLAGVVDVHDRIHAKRLKMQGRYINSGMLLLNLDYHREYKLVDKYKERLKYIHFHRDEFVFHDQDIFNYVCDGSIKYLSLRNNLMTSFLIEGVDLQEFNNDSSDKLSVSQCIIHYTGYPKPWVTHYYGLPLASEWKYYYQLSKWNGEQSVQRIPFWKRLLFFLLRILIKLKVIKPKREYRNIMDVDPDYIPHKLI